MLIALVCVLAWFPVLLFKDRSFGAELDFIRQFYPARYFAVDCLSKGIFPLWNPYVFCGHPFFASYQTAILYPFNFIMIGLYAVSGSKFSLKAQCGFVVFHFFLAGAFMYAAARQLKMSRFASLLAAFTFMFCGYMTAHAGHSNQHSAAAWMPLIFLLFHRAVTRKSVSYSLLSGVALGIALLAGHFQPLFYLCFMLLIYALYQGFMGLKRGEALGQAWFGIFALLIMLAVCVLVASAQLLPTYEMIKLSSRQKLSFEIGSTYSLPRRQTITLLFPHFYGSSPENYTGGWAPAMWELYGYSGILALILGGLALRREDRDMVGFFWLILVLSVVLALGPGGYLFTLFFKAGLLFNRFRDPARILVLFGFSSAILAGFGADHVIESLERGADGWEIKRVRFSALLASVLILIIAVVVSVALLARGGEKAENTAKAIRGMLLPCATVVAFSALILVCSKINLHRKYLLFCGLAGLMLLDLIPHNAVWPAVRVNPDDLYADREACGYLSAKDSVFRVETDAHTMYEALDNGPIYRLEKTTGDDSLVLLRFHNYRESLIPSISPGVQPGLFYEGAIRSPLLDLMNSAYFISRKRIPKVLAENKFVLERRANGVYIYRNLDVLPRAFIAEGEFVSCESESLERIRGSKNKALERRVFLEREGGAYRDGDIIKSVSGAVKFTRTEPGRIRIDVEPGASGVLFLSEAWYPGWEAFVDGKKVRIYKADYLFMGVILKKGSRSVEFVYSSTTVRNGILISCATITALLAYLIAFRALRASKRRALKDSVSERSSNQLGGLD